MYMDTKPGGGRPSRKAQSPMYRRPSRKKPPAVIFNKLEEAKGRKAIFNAEEECLSVSTGCQRWIYHGFPPSSPFFFYSLLHHLVSWNHRLPQNPPSPLADHLQKGPSKPWPILHSQPRAWPLRLELMLVPQLMDRQTASRDTRDQASRPS